MGLPPRNLRKFGVPTGLGSLFTQKPYGMPTVPKALASTLVPAPGGGLRIQIPSPYPSSPPMYLGVSPQTVGTGVTFQALPDKLITLNVNSSGALVWRTVVFATQSVTELPYTPGQMAPGGNVTTTAPTGQLVVAAPPPEVAQAKPVAVTTVSNDYAAEVKRVMANIAQHNAQVVQEVQQGSRPATDLPPDALLPPGVEMPTKVVMASLFGNKTVLIGAMALGLFILWRFRERQ